MTQNKFKLFARLLLILLLISSGWFARSLFTGSEIWGERAMANQHAEAAHPSLMPLQARANPDRPLQRALPVRVIRLGDLPAPRRLDRYRGTIEASKSSDLSFRRAGRVAEILVREGDRVMAGQTLARLESNDVQATMRGIESRIKEAQAVLAEQEAGPRQEAIKAAQAILRERESALSLARLTLDREQSLLASRASSRQAYDEAKSALDRTGASVEAAREQLNELLAGTRIEQINAQQARIESLQAQRDDLQVQLDDCRLLAPFSGVIGNRYLDEGIIAGPELPILKLLQVDPLEARFGVSADDAARLKVGQSVLLTSGDQPAEARISRIEPELDLATRTQGIVVAIDSQRAAPGQTEAKLIPGQTVSLSFNDFQMTVAQDSDAASTAPTSNPLWVPVPSLSRSVRGLWSVLKLSELTPDNWVVERHIVQVLEVDGGFSRISGATVQSGDWIVSEGIHRLTPGMSVAPVELESPMSIDSLHSP